MRSKMTPTKIILLLLGFILSVTYAIQIQTSQDDGDTTDVQEPTGRVIVIDSNTFNADVDNQETIEDTRITNPYDADLSLPNSGPNSDDTLNTGTRMTVQRDETRTFENELNNILYPNTLIQNLARDRYAAFRSSMTFSAIDIVISETSMIFQNNPQASISADLNAIIIGFLGLSDRFSDIHGLFSMNPLVTVESMNIQYFFNADLNGYTIESYDINITDVQGQYRVESADMVFTDIRTLFDRITADPNPDFTENVFYFGYLDFEDESGIDTPDTIGMDRQVDFITNMTDYYARNLYNRVSPEFDWYINPDALQLNINLLLTYLDQDENIQNAISARLGTYDSDFTDTTTIPAPKGLSDLNILSINEATFHSRSGEYSRLLINCRMPDFTFIPLEVPTTDNACFINYTDASTIRVEVNGTVQLNDQAYDSFFLKDVDSTTYNMTLTGRGDAVLSLATVRDVILPTMETQTLSAVLTDEQEALDRLARFGITEEDYQIEDPVIEIRLQPYLFYRINGRSSFGPEINNEINVRGELANLDGAVLSYFRFIFRPSYATSAFRTFFNTDGTDAGFQGLRITDFQVISLNRDFNLDKIIELRNTNIMLAPDNDVIAKRGLTAVLEASLLRDCRTNTFCRLLKTKEVPSNFTLAGFVSPQNTILSGDFQGFELNPLFNIASPTLNVTLVDQDDGTSFVNTTVEGNFIIEAETDRNINIQSIIYFTNTTDDPLICSGRTNGIYDDVFGSPVIDLTENNANGQIYSDGTVLDFQIEAILLYGRN